MNFNYAVPVIPLVVAAAVICSAATAGETTFEQALSREYARYNHALAAKDIRTIVGMLTPDFSWNLGNGKALNRRQTRAALIEYFAGIRSVERAAFRLGTISAGAGQVQVIVTETVTVLVSPESGNARQRRRRRRTTTEKLRETWVQTNRGWKIKKSDLLDSKETFAAVP